MYVGSRLKTSIRYIQLRVILGKAVFNHYVDFLNLSRQTYSKMRLNLRYYGVRELRGWKRTLVGYKTETADVSNMEFNSSHSLVKLRGDCNLSLLRHIVIPYQINNVGCGDYGWMLKFVGRQFWFIIFLGKKWETSNFCIRLIWIIQKNAKKKVYLI